MALVDTIKSWFTGGKEDSADQAVTNNLTESQKKLEDAFATSQNNRTTAEAETNRLNQVSQAAYDQTKLETEQAQNQFAQNQAANQLTALDAIRRSNASAIANGANAGLSAANQLSSILGLQQDTSQEATNIANTAIDNAAKLNTQLNENAVTGAQTANEINAALGANEAELAKAIASNSAAIADVKAAELAAASNENTTNTTAKTESDKLEVQKAADNKEKLKEQQESITKNLDNIAASVDNNIYVKSHYDPFTKKTDTTLDDNLFKNKVERIKQKTIEVYNSGDQAAIDAWNKELEKFNKDLVTSKDSDFDTDDDDGGCVAPGTLITLIDGSKKAVEHLTKQDKLLVWDVVEGGWKEASILFIHQLPEENREVIKLEFENDIKLETVYDHGLFDINLMKYVYIKTLEDALQYLGHDFFYHDDKNFIKRLTLKNASVEHKKTTAYGPCTAKHLCAITNGLLTVPGDTESFTNVCAVDPNTLCYNSKQLFNYIETFGLFSEKDFEGLLPASSFFAFQGPLLKIKIAKGETSMEEINKLIERYSEYIR